MFLLTTNTTCPFETMTNQRTAAGYADRKEKTNEKKKNESIETKNNEEKKITNRSIILC